MEAKPAAVDPDFHGDNEDENAGGVGASNLEGKNIFLRDGNVAYEIERPLFEQEVGIDLHKLKADYMKKVALDGQEASETSAVVT
jgi:hypothetical protein